MSAAVTPTAAAAQSSHGSLSSVTSVRSGASSPHKNGMVRHPTTSAGQVKMTALGVGASELDVRAVHDELLHANTHREMEAATEVAIAAVEQLLRAPARAGSRRRIERGGSSGRSLREKKRYKPRRVASRRDMAKEALFTSCVGGWLLWAVVNPHSLSPPLRARGAHTLGRILLFAATGRILTANSNASFAEALASRPSYMSDGSGRTSPSAASRQDSTTSRIVSQTRRVGYTEDPSAIYPSSMVVGMDPAAALADLSAADRGDHFRASLLTPSGILFVGVTALVNQLRHGPRSGRPVSAEALAGLCAVSGEAAATAVTHGAIAPLVEMLSTCARVIASSGRSGFARLLCGPSRRRVAQAIEISVYAARALGRLVGGCPQSASRAALSAGALHVLLRLISQYGPDGLTRACVEASEWYGGQLLSPTRSLDARRGGYIVWALVRILQVSPAAVHHFSNDEAGVLAVEQLLMLPRTQLDLAHPDSQAHERVRFYAVVALGYAATSPAVDAALLMAPEDRDGADAQQRVDGYATLRDAGDWGAEQRADAVRAMVRYFDASGLDDERFSSLDDAAPIHVLRRWARGTTVATLVLDDSSAARVEARALLQRILLKLLGYSTLADARREWQGGSAGSEKSTGSGSPKNRVKLLRELRLLVEGRGTGSTGEKVGSDDDVDGNGPASEPSNTDAESMGGEPTIIEDPDVASPTSWGGGEPEEK